MIKSLTCHSGSQEERIEMLKLALTEKGVLTSGHCDLESPAKSVATTDTTEALPSSINEDEGLHL